ncbi:MAG: hypothetical protein LBV55_03050 [Acholeplasmatales bacterium]|jgi:hypothetical protein|nr:hypothetical protein [Acholeplasmatales bacterium]
MSKNKISNIAYIEELLTNNKKGLTFQEIQDSILEYSGVPVSNYLYYSQVLEDMARSGTIVRDGEGRYFLKFLKRELWDTPFYNFNILANDVDSSEEAGKYEKNSKFDNIEYEEEDISELELEEILDDIEEEEEEYEAEVSEEEIDKDILLENLDEEEFEEEEFEEEFEEEEY